MGDANKIYAGINNDLGYFEADGKGRMVFHSLKYKLPEDKQGLTPVASTFFIDGKVFFNTGKYQLIWDTKRQVFTILESESAFLRPFVIENSLYQVERGKGLTRYTEGRFSLVPGGELFATSGLSVMLPLKNEKGKKLLVTRTQGMFLYDGDQFTPLPSEVNDFLNESRVYSGSELADGNIVLGTVSGGAVVINSKGELLKSYNQGNGLRDNSIYYSFQDRSGGLWLGTANGISRVAHTSPVQWFDERSGLISIVNDLVRHENTLYVGTSSGLFAFDPQSAKFNELEGVTTQYWKFYAGGEELLVGSGEGLFKVEKEEVIPVRPNDDKKYTVTAITRSVNDPARIFVGTMTGLWSLRKNGKNYFDEGRLAGFESQPNSIVDNKDGSLWIGTMSSGVFRISIVNDDQGKPIPEKSVLEQFNVKHGLQEGSIYIHDIKGTVYFNSPDSLYVFDESSKRFVADTSLVLIRDYNKFPVTANKAKSLFQDQQNNLWFETKGRLAMAIVKADGSYEWMTAPFNRISDASPYYSEENGTLWMSSDEGLMRFDMEAAKLTPADYRALIRKVTMAGDSVLYFGSTASQPAIPDITYATNSLRFDFGAASFEDRSKLRFATYLQGFDKDWTPWTNEPFKEYTNLAPGTYTFQVKAIDLNGMESIVAKYSFEILPPWWRTWWAYALFVLLFLAGGFAILRWRTKSLKREKEVLEQKVALRTTELKQSLDNLKSTQGQLIQSEKMASLGELTAGIAHEIQNPLNFVNNFSEINKELLVELKAEIIKGNLDEVNAIADDVISNEEKINQHGKRADAIVKGMLQHSRSSSGQKEPTDINALCDEYLRLAYHGLRAKDKSFNAIMKTDFDNSIGSINIIPQDIGRVVLNLINNAFYVVDEKKKLSSNGYEPTVSVSTKRINGKMEIKVADNGSGIPQKVLDKIFQPFFTTKPTGEGTGLGLSLSYDIVKSHGGEIKVNTKEGEGSSFIISIPANS
jgi:signal transduction histidine kinase